MTKAANTPCVVIVRDGWGRNPNAEHDTFNAVKIAKTPVADMLERDWPTTLIRTSGEDVGLPDGTMGNSEVGHQNIGAGRVVDQDSVRISKAVREDKLRQHDALVEAIDKARKSEKTVHLMGICSDAGVHGLLTHLYGVLDLCKEFGNSKIVLHLFTDGRDTGPFTGKGFIEQVENRLDEVGVGRIGSVIGRYYAMDRDNRWERVHRAYACLTGRDAEAQGVKTATTATEAVTRYYDQPSGETMRGDEFVTPTMIGRDEEDIALTRIADGDSVIFYNYRGDRPREIISAFVLPEFEGHVKPSPDTGVQGFDRGEKLDLTFVCMTAYAEFLLPYVKVAFPKPPRMKNIAGEYLSSLGLTQFRCAETEKFPHVTFFFNDYRDEPFEGESREILQSPKVATYDMAPEMAAAGVRDAVLGRLAADDCEDVIVVNFANGDMVGHTGSLDAAVKACEYVDACVGQIVEKTLARGGSLIITADHGNAEQMWDPGSDAPHTAHTTYRVPLTVVCEAMKDGSLREGGRLADIMPTALEIMGLDTPSEMTGESLLEPAGG